MDTETAQRIEELASIDDKVRLNALQTVLNLTEQPVDWAYAVWDEMTARLTHENSYQRSIGIMVLCSLAKSDHENRMAAVLDDLLAHTRDEKFITSRQCIQNVWKVAAANADNRGQVIAHLEQRFRECGAEKHYNLLRLDVIQALKNVYDQVDDPSLLERARELMAGENEAAYRKKYEAVLKGK